MREFVRQIFIYIAKVCRLYIDYVDSFFEYMLVPLSDYISNYSSTLAYTVDNIRKILSGFVVYIPIFFVSLVPIVSKMSVLDSSLGNYSVLFSSTLFVSSIISIYVSKSMLDNNWIDTIYTFSIILISSVLVIYYNQTPYLYIILSVIIYSIGAFSQSKIDFDKSVSHDYIYNTLNSHTMIALSSIASVFVIPVIVLSDTYLDDFEKIAQFLGCSVIYLVTVYQESQYRPIYSGINIDTSSRLWILSPRIGVVIGSILIIFPGISFIYGIPMLILPFLFGCLFYIYFEYMTNNHIGDIVFRGLERSMHGESKDTVLENVSIERTSNKRTSKLAVNLNISVEKSPKETSGNLAESVILLQYIERILLESDLNEKQDSYRDVKEFHDSQIDVIIDQDFEIEELPYVIRRRIISRMSERECITNQEIQDMRTRNHNKSH